MCLSTSLFCVFLSGIFQESLAAPKPTSALSFGELEKEDPFLSSMFSSYSSKCQYHWSQLNVRRKGIRLKFSIR